MAWGALSLAIASFICIGLGVLFTPVPGVGAVFAFGAPLLALAGIIVGGRAVSAAKAAVAGVPGPGGAMVSAPGQASGIAQAAVIASALAFVPAVITALTCGACNALCATADFRTSHRLGTGIDPLDVLRRAGMQQAGGPADPDPSTVPSVPSDGGVPTDPSALPPPPLAPGPPP